MPFTPRPSVLPEWAMIIQNNGINGEPSVVEPPPEKKLVGWVFKEKPNRQYWNWFQRTVSQWIAYLDDNLDFTGDQFTPVWSNLDVGSLTTNYGFYSREGDKCFFTVHAIWGGNAFSGNFTLTNLPFLAKNQVGFIQSIHCTRGSGPTLAAKGIISGLINANTNVMDVWQENPTTGTGQVVNDAESQGQLIFSGFYFIEDI